MADGDEVSVLAHLSSGLVSAPIPDTDCMIVRAKHYNRMLDENRWMRESIQFCSGSCGLNLEQMGQ